MNDILAIIPARGHSKGILRKNLQPLAGRPLLAWTIAAALASKRITRVIVSTDDPEIARVSCRYGAEVVDRPPELSRDSSGSEEALLHVLEQVRDGAGSDPELVVFLQCTAPLTAASDIDGTIDVLEREQADSALAVIPFHYFLWHPDGTGVNHDKRERKLRQEKPPEFLEAGAVYVMKTAGFLEHRHRFFGKTALYEMNPAHRWEIDEPVDLEIAEMLMRRRTASNRELELPWPLDAVVMDFDGVLTNNRVIVSEDGHEAVVCNRGDGMGLEHLKSLGIPLLVISKERNPVVTARCDKLKIPVLQGIDDKWSALELWLKESGHLAENIVYVGNDINDADCMRRVGCAVAVADANDSIMSLARIILERAGGDGAIRELCDLIVRRHEFERRNDDHAE